MEDIHTAMVEFPGNGDLVPGFIAHPADLAGRPAVVVIQEWWGLNDHIRDVTRRFAQEGYVALAPDLYRGQVTDEPDEAGKLSMELAQERAMADIQGAVDHLAAQPFVTPKQAGVVGFCMGGALALWMGLQGQRVGASVVFYGGRNPIDPQIARQTETPILGLYGEADHGIPLEVVLANEKTLREAGKTVQFVIYPDAPHAFFNDTRASYRREAAEDAWARTLDWFRSHLS